MKTHGYAITVEWTGNDGQGTGGYNSYRRDHTIASGERPVILGSSDPAFRGDPSRYNPEELLVASLSACHMLWYLHLCSDRGVVVTAYRDEALGEMREERDGSGQFTRVQLRPRVAIADGTRTGLALDLHHAAHAMCYIARSVNFPVEVMPMIG